MTKSLCPTLIFFSNIEAQARLAALRELGPISISEKQIDSIAFHAQRFAEHDNKIIAWLSREYIFHERLFSWTHDRAKRDRYRFIYELAGLNISTSDEVTRNDLRNAARNLGLEGQDFEEVANILDRAALFIRYFGYTNFLQDVTQDGGQWGPASGIGSREKVRVLPGKKIAKSCNRIVVGLANGRRARSKGSLQNVLRAIDRQLLPCRDVTKIAIVITDVWDKESFKYSMDDVASNKRHGIKFIFLLVNGRKLVPMDFSFG